eukprot:GHVP01003644.1.p2 GENE.GHVP01003644.1~~GHVP01003644.1.p2  ORF type:complete len:256 (-),score=53.69 GHVP01003644.1:1642-2409(-)
MSENYFLERLEVVEKFLKEQNDSEAQEILRIIEDEYLENMESLRQGAKARIRNRITDLKGKITSSQPKTRKAFQMKSKKKITEEATIIISEETQDKSRACFLAKDTQNLTIENKKGATIEIPTTTRAISISDVDECTIFNVSSMETVQIVRAKNCIFNFKSIQNSCFIHLSEKCQFTVEAQQLRLVSCHDCKLGVATVTSPVIEASTNLIFFKIPTMRTESRNNWSRIEDFDWPKSTPTPNASLREEGHEKSEFS